MEIPFRSLIPGMKITVTVDKVGINKRFVFRIIES
jgi:hypothetical protein